MKRLKSHVAAAAIVALALFIPNIHAAEHPAGYVDFGDLSGTAAGGEFVEVNLNQHVIAMAARIAQKSEPEIAEILQGLKGVRVNVIGLHDGNGGELRKRIASIRHQLDDQSWERVVTAQQKDDDIGVYLKTRADEVIEGVVVTVIDGTQQAVLVNVVGNIRPERLAEIGERLHLKPLEKIGHALKK